MNGANGQSGRIGAAFAKGTGEIVWKHDRDLGAPEEAAQSYATPIVVQEPGREVIVVLGADHVTTHEAATGKERWRVDFVKELKSPLPSFGFVSSPLVAGDHVYVQAGSGVIKLEKATAKTAPKLTPKLAEVTLYHNGYAVVDVEGKALFDGSLTSGTSDCAHLSYYHADTGEPIILN